MASRNFWKLNIFAWVKRVFIGLVLSLFFFPPGFSAAKDLYSFTSEKDKHRFMQLSQELRCLVCQNQNLADSDAPLARDLRHKIYGLIHEQKSDQEIKQFLVSRYGEFILFSPPVNRVTILLWSFPAVLLLVIFGAIFFRKSSSFSPLGLSKYGKIKNNNFP